MNKNLDRFREPEDEFVVTYCIDCREPLFDGDQAVDEEDGTVCVQCCIERVYERVKIIDRDDWY